MAYEKTSKLLFYAIFIVVLIVLGVSLYTLVEVSSIKSVLQPTGISVNEFIEKLTAHPELSAYSNVVPVNIIQITANNLANLQGQVSGLDISYIGNYVVQYNDRIVVYDFERDNIVANLQLQAAQSQLPADFLAKLIKHVELQGVEAEDPTGGVLDEASLTELKQQFPDVYKDANAGDYLLRYSDRLIIYNYEDDKVIGVFELE